MNIEACTFSQRTWDKINKAIDGTIWFLCAGISLWIAYNW